MRELVRTDNTYTDEGITLHYYGSDEGVVARYREQKWGDITVTIGPARNYGDWVGPDDLVTVTKEKYNGEWCVSMSWSSWGRRYDADIVSRITDTFAIAQAWHTELGKEA